MFPFSYRKAGIVGINARNSRYIFPSNKRRYYRLVDDKLETKRLAATVNIPVPKLYGVVEFQRQLRDLTALIGDHRQFVIKPALGSGGEGIVVVKDRKGPLFIKASGGGLTLQQLQQHVGNTLSGLYSLGGQNDRAIIEYAVQFDPIFEGITWNGVPDVRILLYHGVPAMAMLRLPTQASDGKANLHMGGIGCGVEISTGITTTAVQQNRYITHHPETGTQLVGHEIPHWEAMLNIAAQFHPLTRLGYLGVDIVLDKDLGPLVLEVNARPGISIQVANGAGLRSRLDAVEKALPNLQTIDGKVEFAIQNF